MNINELLLEKESEFLDFKENFPSNTMKLIHDILCLANSHTNSDRYLIFGVKDDKTVCGIENDPNIKTNSNIQDLLRQSNFNKIPTVDLSLVGNVQGHTVAVIRIKNSSDKPYFLTKDKSYDRGIIRAGVVYTRLGDTNTPLKETAHENYIELMWRDRFGLDLDVASRIFILVNEKDKWVKNNSESYIYHKDFPEFTIKDGKISNSEFQLSWTKKFPDITAWSYCVEVRCHSTILTRLLFIACDGGRYKVPMPMWDENKQEWFINKNTLAYKISELYDQHFPLHKVLPGFGVRLIEGPTGDWETADSR